jgi:hypothetical protein
VCVSSIEIHLNLGGGTVSRETHADFANP